MGAGASSGSKGLPPTLRQTSSAEIAQIIRGRGAEHEHYVGRFGIDGAFLDNIDEAQTQQVMQGIVAKKHQPPLLAMLKHAKERR